MHDATIYFLVGLLTSFIGTIPFGPINLTVVKITVDHNPRCGIEVALAASLVEILHASIAISFGLIISGLLDTNRFIKLFIAAAFIVLAAVVFTRKTAAELNSEVVIRRGYFIKGLFLAALNPQAIPFWIFALTVISQYTVSVYSGINLTGFLAGVFAGKLMALTAFVYASKYLKRHLNQSSKLVNFALAIVLLFIGMSQLWNAL